MKFIFGILAITISSICNSFSAARDEKDIIATRPQVSNFFASTAELFPHLRKELAAGRGGESLNFPTTITPSRNRVFFVCGANKKTILIQGGSKIEIDFRSYVEQEQKNKAAQKIQALWRTYRTKKLNGTLHD
ncbi:MAG: hypothetical protein WCG05_03740 [Alphaproteobacteria bacterium]